MLVSCVCVCLCVPISTDVLLKVDQQSRNYLLHVSRLPNVYLQLVVHRFSDHTLQTTDARHTNSRHTREHYSIILDQQLLCYLY